MLPGLLEDLRFSFRVFRNNPGPTAVAVITLALGIAANTTVFGWVYSLLLHPFPGVERSDDLAAIETISPGGEFHVTSFPDYRDFRDRTTFAAGMSASLLNAFNIGDDQQPARVWGEYVTSNHFAVLGIGAHRGRVFTPADFGDAPGSHPWVVISHRLWERQFHHDRSVIGRVVRLNRYSVKVLGVAPPGFYGTVPGLFLDVWVPVTMAPQLNGQGDWALTDRSQRQFWVTARLKPGVSVERASAELRSLAKRIAEGAPASNKGFSAEVMPVWKAHFGAQGLLLRPLQVLMAICAILFLIVAANVTNLQLARATAREKEFGIRLAMGAGRVRLVRQLLTESLVLAGIGTAAGVLLSLWLAQSLSWLMPPVNLPIAFDFALNYKILAFTGALCVGVAVLTGIAPAIHAARGSLNKVLKDATATSSGSTVHRTRQVLVAAEIALALVAMVGTGLFVESFRRARAIAPGFNASKVLLAQSHLATFCRSNEDRKDFVLRLSGHLRTAPGVETLSYSDAIPLALGTHPTTTVHVEGYSARDGEDLRVASNEVGPEFLRTLGIPLLEGRDFTSRDDAKAKPVAIVNEAFAKRYTSGRNPVGTHMRVRGRRTEIVGLAKDTKFAALTDGPKPYLYLPYLQNYGGQFWIAFFVRTSGPPEQSVGAIRREIGRIDPNAAVADIMPYSDYIGTAVYPQKVAATLLTGLGAVSLFLAAVGIYTLLAFTVAQRKREFGIRIALGARPHDVVWLVLRQAAGLSVLGICAGMVVAMVLVPFGASLLVGVTPADPMILGGAVGFLAIVALLSGFAPASDAAEIDPVIHLRQQ